MLQQTVSRNLIKFQRCNYNMIDFLKTKQRFGRPIKIIGSEDLQAKLLSESSLKRWAHLSIHKRCLKIKNLYGIDVPV